MSKKSMELVTLAGCRVAKRLDERFPGISFSGIYYPAEANGTSARFETTVVINRGDYTDATGKRVERDPDYARLVFWNGRGAAAGKGLADIAAKCLSPGKEISVMGNVHSYMGRVFFKGQPMNFPDGTPIEIQKNSITIIPGSLLLGADSEKQEDFEIANWNRQPGIFSFFARPAGWATRGTQDNQTWQAISAQRMATVYNGGDHYGYALIRRNQAKAAPPIVDMNTLSPHGVAAATTPVYTVPGPIYPTTSNVQATIPSAVAAGQPIPGTVGQAIYAGQVPF